jgi:surface antigen
MHAQKETSIIKRRRSPMPNIGADTAQMHATVAAMRQGSSAIQEAFQQAAQAMQSMQGSRWSGQHRAQAEEFWNRIRSQFGPTIETLDTLAARTERVANALDEAGRVFGGAGAPGSSTINGTQGGDQGTVPTAPPSHAPLPSGRTKQWVLDRTAGCTTYVLSRVNLDAMNRWPDAQGWNEAATAAGFPVGTEPATGSVMVFEPGVMGAHNTAGHVAYVENVVREGDTIRVTISEANVATNQNGVIWGGHTTPSTRQIEFKQAADGSLLDTKGNPVTGVSFIYGKS